MRVREYITNILLIAQALAFLVHFSLIAYHGQVTIQEPSLVILVLEFALFTGIIVLGVVNIIKGQRRLKHGL